METSPSDGSGSSEALVFLQKDYELKVRYLSDHYGRIWTRFNFFMVATTGLIIAMSTGLRDGKTLGDSSAFLYAGTLLALCWYVFGAQDRYLVEAYRQQIERIANALDASLGLSAELAKSSINSVGSKYWPVHDIEHVNVNWKLYQWRVESISVTKLVAIFPFVVLLGWVLLILARFAK